MKGELLKDHIARRWKSTPLPEDASDAPAWHRDASPLDGLFHQASKTERQKRIDEHYDRTVAQVLSELASGDVPVLGRFKLDDGKLSDPVWIERRFWIDASFHYNYGAASDCDRFFDVIKVLPPEARDVEVENPSIIVEQQPAPSVGQECQLDLTRMSKEEIRLHAIDVCASPNQLDWWHKGPADRRVGYATHLASQHHLNVVRASGYGADSWDASENKYKKPRGLLKT